MPNYAALKAEDAKALYNGQTDVQRSTAINALTISGVTSFSSVAAVKALMFLQTEDWGWIVQIATNVGIGSATGVTQANNSFFATPSVNNPVTVDAVIQRACIQMQWLLGQPNDITVLSGAEQTLLTQGLAFLVSKNVISTAGQTAVLALCSSSTSWPVFYGFPQGVNPDELKAARLWNG